MSRRLASLDGLRAICVLAVFLNGLHWLVPFGWIGVQVFYVLSGYLITDVLVRQRARGDSAYHYFSSFHARRALRIFPVYYAFLAALHLAASAWPSAVAEWTNARVYALTFTTNLGLVQHAFPVTDATGHLWSLAVEQQFYLLWPCLVWLTPRDSQAKVAWLLVALGPLIRVMGERGFGYTYGQTYLASQSHLDAFACGALVPWFAAHITRLRTITAVMSALTLALGVVVMLGNHLALRTLGYPESLYAGYAHIWGYSAINLTAALLVATLLRGHGAALGQPVLAYVGRISYAVYLFQRPLQGLAVAQVEPLLLGAPRWAAYCIVGALALGAAIALAAITDRWIEQPLLAWRNRKLPAAA